MSGNTGMSLFQRAELLYHAGDTRGALDGYCKSIKRILNDENVTALAPVGPMPDNFPREMLGLVWQNFVGFLRDPNLNFNEDTAPAACNLLKIFKPGATSPQLQRWSPRFQSTEHGRILFKALQITAGFTLGLQAWNRQDRATAARRYQEALDLAQTHTPFVTFPNTFVGLEKYVSTEVQETKDNLDVLERNDTANATLAASLGQSTGRRDVVDMPTNFCMKRIEGNGEENLVNSVMLATNACAKCGIHKMSLQKCGRCKSTLYCGAECQRSHWPSHKPTCRRPAQFG
ncbi:hypothetical protein CPB83DRAFT_805144 [Crepidotus variabilis]|uniref:MYND-type domain-containing protein n=1 Tax=Crepidotus variabilis TaxID=179855 RepID=A0A9P6ES61_9AGAR|nr:hypothetical protein CPB83DRAFT_805144 [Crepidotus variabilis]